MINMIYKFEKYMLNFFQELKKHAKLFKTNRLYVKQLKKSKCKTKSRIVEVSDKPKVDRNILIQVPHNLNVVFVL